MQNPERCERAIGFLYCYSIPVLLWMGIIFILSDQEGLDGSGWHISIALLLERKLAHVAEYAVLTGLLLRLLRAHFPKNLLVSSVAAFFIALLFAFSDEWHQTFVVGREGKLSDVMIDATGMVVALALLSIGKVRRIFRIQ